MGKHNETGKKGEDLATNFLATQGIIILERNWRHGRAEVDIIGMDNKTMIFVEVKTRSDDYFERPEAAIDAKKRSLMSRAAIAYMHKSGHDWLIRFDVVSIILRGSHEPQIDLFKDAFFPNLGD
jgi:putative endonuclease